jgi:glycosyltransferase involved in cell wall biosynthesis
LNKTKKKILVFVDWFYPGFKGGGPIRSCFNLVTMLQHDFDVKVITRDTDFGEIVSYPEVVSDKWSRTASGIQVLYLSKHNLSYSTIRRLLVEEQADHVYLNSMYSKHFSIYPLLACRFNKLPASITLAPRGMLYQSAINRKIVKKKTFLFLLTAMGLHKSIRFHATNNREKDAVHAYFGQVPVFVADNLPAQEQLPLTVCEKTKGALRCIFISRIDPIKNLLLLLEILKDIKADVLLDIIGPVEDESYWQQCMTIIGSWPSNIQARLHGAVKNELIQTYIMQSHLFVLLSAGENFGHAIFETFLAGRPVLISNQTPWLELEIKKIGWDLDISDRDAISTALERAAAWDQETFHTWSTAAWTYAHNYLANTKYKDAYYRIFA